MKYEKGNGSDITSFSRSDVRSTRKVKIRVIETLEMRMEFQELGRGEERGRGSECHCDGVSRYADRAGTRGVQLISIVP